MRINFINERICNYKLGDSNFFKIYVVINVSKVLEVLRIEKLLQKLENLY